MRRALLIGLLVGLGLFLVLVYLHRAPDPPRPTWGPAAIQPDS